MAHVKIVTASVRKFWFGTFTFWVLIPEHSLLLWLISFWVLISENHTLLYLIISLSTYPSIFNTLQYQILQLYWWQHTLQVNVHAQGFHPASITNFFQMNPSLVTTFLLSLVKSDRLKILWHRQTLFISLLVIFSVFVLQLLLDLYQHKKNWHIQEDFLPYLSNLSQSRLFVVLVIAWCVTKSHLHYVVPNRLSLIQTVEQQQTGKARLMLLVVVTCYLIRAQDNNTERSE